MQEEWFESLLRQSFASHCQRDYVAPVEWCQRNISFRRTVSSEFPEFRIDKGPYLQDPIAYWEFSGKIREMTCIGPQQTGKSLTWLLPLAWTFRYKPCLSLVVYESDEKAKLINEDKLKPILREIKQFELELNNPRSSTKNCYNFSNLKSFFMGAGAPVTSYSAKIRVADELDKWIEHDNKVANIDEVRSRAASFSESFFAKVCTVDGSADGSKIWKEFLASSQGYWHLTCLNCGKPSMRSADIHNMQWELTERGGVIKDSIRLVCPLCRHEHYEADKAQMNIRGKYLHEWPERFDNNAGFQWGALASQSPVYSWWNIAESQLKAGRSGDYQDQLRHDNTIRGLPYQRRASAEKEENELKKHCVPLPESSIIQYVLFSADTQGDCFYWVVRGYDEQKNSYLLGNGRALNLDELAEVMQEAYLNKRPVMSIIDSGGHRTKEVQRFSYGRPSVVMYKGYTQNVALTRWKFSDNDNKLVLANPKTYQADLLYRMYERSHAAESAWYLPPDVTEDYKKQMLDMKPDKKKKAGHDFKNWEGTGNDHYFDAEKMILVLDEIYNYILNLKKAQNNKETRKCKVERE